MSWPIGMGKRFKGVYNLYENKIVLYKPHQVQEGPDSIEITDLSDSKLDDIIGSDEANTLREEVELITGVYPEFSRDDYLNGTLTPVFFGSALNNFGVKELLDCFIDYAPTPISRETDLKLVEPDHKKFSGFILKFTRILIPNTAIELHFYGFAQEYLNEINGF